MIRPVMRTGVSAVDEVLEGGLTRTVRPALPTNDKQLWVKLIQLDLKSHPPQAAILSLTLSAEPGSTSKVQLGLFSPARQRSSKVEALARRPMLEQLRQENAAIGTF